jgi:cytochrome c biogenesis protein CcmG/thiol:disulfide interchange protein DsbE
VIAVLGSIFAFGLGRDPTHLPSELVGHRAPEFSLGSLSGQTIDLRSLRGKVVVLNFWASWCIACRQEHPNLVAAWELYGDSGVVFLGVLFQDTPQYARQFMKDLGGGWPTLLDPGGRTAISYGVAGVPETFFIGPDGRIGYKQVGYSSYELLVSQIKALMKVDAGGETAYEPP